MNVGDGTMYDAMGEECYNIIMAGLNDPSSEIAETLVELSGMEIADIKAALGQLVYDSNQHLWYYPYQNDDWDLMGDNKYTDLNLALGEIWDSEDNPCAVGPTILLNSHQGHGGF